MKGKIDRNFVNKVNVSRHLSCTICQDLFDNPVRLNCGHTFCNECINGWLDSPHSIKDKLCPICRKKITKNQISKDLIAFNLINDMEVFCNNKNCPWKGLLNDLKNHLDFCVFENSKLSDNVKNYIKDFNKNNSKEDIFDYEDDPTFKYLSFNKNSSLKARLFNKNSQLIINSLNNSNEGNNKYLDLLEIESIYSNKMKENDFCNSEILNHSNNNIFLENKKKSINDSELNAEKNSNIDQISEMDGNPNNSDSIRQNGNNDTTTFSDRDENKLLKNDSKKNIFNNDDQIKENNLLSEEEKFFLFSENYIQPEDKGNKKILSKLTRNFGDNSPKKALSNKKRHSKFFSLKTNTLYKLGTEEKE